MRTESQELRDSLINSMIGKHLTPEDNKLVKKYLDITTFPGAYTEAIEDCNQQISSLRKRIVLLETK